MAKTCNFKNVVDAIYTESRSFSIKKKKKIAVIIIDSIKEIKILSIETFKSKKILVKLRIDSARAIEKKEKIADLFFVSIKI